VSAYLSLNDQRVISGRVTFPRWGAWTAETVLANSEPISPAAGGCRIKIGNLALRATAIPGRMASFAGSRSVLMVGGFGGWRKVLPARGYTHPSGLMLSTILNDAARECGETIVVTGDVPVGPAFARRGGREQDVAERVLRELLAGKWWIDTDGVTRTSDRAATPIKSAFTVEQWSGSRGRFLIATEAYEDWMPGRTFSAPTVTTPQTISTVSIIAENDGKVRLEVLTDGNKEDRLQDQIRHIIRDEMASMGLAALVEYTVRAATPATVDLEVADPTTGWPSMLSVPMFPGLLGEKVTPNPGTRAVMAFLNADPTKPRLMHLDGIPLLATIDATTFVKIGQGALPAARAGDLAAGIFPIITTQAKTLV